MRSHSSSARPLMCSASIPEAMRQRTLWTLYGCNLLASVGFWFFLPLLPIFLSRRGGSPTLVGAGFAAGPLRRAANPDPAGRGAACVRTPAGVVGGARPEAVAVV